MSRNDTQGRESLLAKIGRLKNNKEIMRYFENTSWLLGERILRMAVALFVSVWMARYLGPEQFGLLSYAQSYVALFTALAAAGLDSIVVKELVKNESKREILLGTAFRIKLISAIGVLLLISLLNNVTSNDYFTNLIIFIIAGGLLFQSFNVIDFYFQSKVLSKYVAYSNTITLAISSAIKIYLIINEAPLIAFAWVLLFDSFILALGLLYFYFHNHLSFKAWVYDAQVARKLIQDSWPLVLSGIAISVYMRIDQVMIKEILGTESVGQYTAALKISEAWYFIPIVISSSLFPSIIEARKLGNDLYYENLQRLFNLMVWIGVTIAIPMTLMSGWIINLLYGEEYNQAGNVLMIHIWTGVFVFLGVASGKWLISEGLQKISFIRTFYGAILNILMNLYMIPEYGIQGAAAATLVSQITVTYLYDFFNPRTRHVFYMKTRSLLFQRRK